MPILHWLKREEALRAADAAPYRLLEADPALSAGDPDSGNMLGQGRDVGRFWQDRSSGQAVFLWAVKRDAAGRTVAQQLGAAVGDGRISGDWRPETEVGAAEPQSGSSHQKSIEVAPSAKHQASSTKHASRTSTK